MEILTLPFKWELQNFRGGLDLTSRDHPGCSIETGLEWARLGEGRPDKKQSECL